MSPRCNVLESIRVLVSILPRIIVHALIPFAVRLVGSYSEHGIFWVIQL